MRKLLFLMALGLSSISPAMADAKFERFIESLWPRIERAGFSRELFDAAFEGITDADPLVIKQSANQPEFTSTTSEYLAKAVTPIRIESGRAMLAKNAKLLSAIEARYGVDRRILLGIWGMESNFGKDLGSMRVMRSLSTLLYIGRKEKYANEQLIASFAMLKRGMRQPDNFTGSWAAAMGHTQFIPTTYLSASADWTGDGVRDIWGSKEDALASTGNYLKLSGWKADRPWGLEVKLPKDFDRSLVGRKHWKTMADWSAMGIRPINGGSLPSPHAKAFIVIPQGMAGPRFLVTQNFLALLAYNNSHAYAVAVGHLGDRIKGLPGIQASWPDQVTDLNLAERIELQKRLSAAGFNTGGADGRFGARTYEAVLGFQKRIGMMLDGYPTREVLERLRQGG